MIIYCWPRGNGAYYLDRKLPAMATRDDLFSRRIAGDPIRAFDTIVFVAPDGMAPFLPTPGEVRAMRFHEQLWDVAKGLPSYEKRLWVEMQRMLESQTAVSLSRDRADAEIVELRAFNRADAIDEPAIIDREGK